MGGNLCQHGNMPECGQEGPDDSPTTANYSHRTNIPQNHETLNDQRGTTLAASQARANCKITSVIATSGYSLAHEMVTARNHAEWASFASIRSLYNGIMPLEKVASVLI